MISTNRHVIGKDHDPVAVLKGDRISAWKVRVYVLGEDYNTEFSYMTLFYFLEGQEEGAIKRMSNELKYHTAYALVEKLASYEV